MRSESEVRARLEELREKRLVALLRCEFVEAGDLWQEARWLRWVLEPGEPAPKGEE